jgi:hypothetical protein
MRPQDLIALRKEEIAPNWSQIATSSRKHRGVTCRPHAFTEHSAIQAANVLNLHQVLKECMKSRAHVIGSEPTVLLENYVRLLEEKFMDDSEIAWTALKIYQQHKRALDVIFANRPDNIERMCATTARNIGLSAGRLKTVEVPLPPLAELTAA